MKTLLHYSIPGLPLHRARTTDWHDARRLATELTNVARLAVVLAHYSVDGKEVVEVFETIV